MERIPYFNRKPRSVNGNGEIRYLTAAAATGAEDLEALRTNPAWILLLLVALLASTRLLSAAQLQKKTHGPHKV